VIEGEALICRLGRVSGVDEYVRVGWGRWRHVGSSGRVLENHRL